jgi:hypothetical protein
MVDFSTLVKNKKIRDKKIKKARNKYEILVKDHLEILEKNRNLIDKTFDIIQNYLEAKHNEILSFKSHSEPKELENITEEKTINNDNASEKIITETINLIAKNLPDLSRILLKIIETETEILKTIYNETKIEEEAKVEKLSYYSKEDIIKAEKYIEKCKREFFPESFRNEEKSELQSIG